MAADPEGVGSEGRAVVGDHPLNGDAQFGKVLSGRLPGRRRHALNVCA